MRNFIVWAILLILSLLFQTTIINSLAIKDIRPNLSLSLFILFALKSNSCLKSQIVGFIFGLLEDFTSSSLFGMNGFSKALVGYAVSSLNLSFKLESLKSQLLLLILATFLNGIALNLLFGLFHLVPLRLGFLKFIFYETLLNIIVFSLLFLGINKLSKYEWA